MGLVALNAALFVVWLLVTTDLYRRFPGTFGILLSALWPLVLLPLVYGYVRVRARRHRRRLIEQEWRR